MPFCQYPLDSCLLHDCVLTNLVVQSQKRLYFLTYPILLISCFTIYLIVPLSEIR
jgi:hypothetical protein